MKNNCSFSYFWKEGFRNIFLYGFMSFAAISVIVACLLITGSVALIAVNIDLEIEDLQKKSEISIFIDKTLSQEEAKGLKNAILKIDNVEEAIFVPKEQALKEYREQLGEQGDVLTEGWEDSKENPLRDGFRIRLKNIALLSDTIDKLSKTPNIANVQSDQEVAGLLVKMRHVFETISWTLIVALGCVSIFIISNTVKLALFARREEIAIMKMVGATNWFIRWPFVIEGLLMGIIGGLIAFFAQWGVYAKLKDTVESTIGAFKMVDFSVLQTNLLMVFVGAGVVIGIGGALLTIRRFLDV